MTVRVGVSTYGAADLSRELARSHPNVECEVIEIQDTSSAPLAHVDVLWRRQPDRTNWMIDVIHNMPTLSWLHTDIVGVERFPLTELQRRGIVLTNGSGALARPVAEWVIWALLTARKAALPLIRDYLGSRWEPSHPIKDLAGSSVAILGRGAIGTAVAELLKPFEVDVRLFGREEGSGAEPAWLAFLERTDLLVIGVPLTTETAGMVGSAALARLKSAAWVVNVSRGAVLDEQALISALAAGQIGGAILDAVVTEPLPSESPLWQLPNVIVLPHIAAASPRATQSHTRLFVAQLAAYCSGEQLRNVVDYRLGY